MKKISITLGIIALTVYLSVLTVHAQPKEKTTATGVVVPQKRNSSTTPQVLAKNNERIERIVAQGEKMQERLDAATTRLTKITDRLDSRIIKIEATGKDLTESKKLVTEIRTDLQNARDTTKVITDTFRTLRESSTAIRPAFELMKNALKNTETLIKTAQKKLVHVITTVKASENVVATTTPTH